MRNDLQKVAQNPLEERPSFLQLAGRVLSRGFWIVGAVANVLGIYSFGEDHHWWDSSFFSKLNFAISSDANVAFRMLAVGIGGPWAMALGVVAGAKVSGWFAGDQSVTNSLIHRVLPVCFFFAVWHCAQMMFGLSIFQGYLSGEGIAKVVTLYLLAGIALSMILAPIVRARARMNQGRA